MDFQINERIAEKHNLSIPQVLFALAVRTSPDVGKDIKDLLDREIMVKNGRDYLVTQRWSEELDEILLDSTGVVDDEEWLDDLVRQFAKFWPPGKMIGNSGPTPYYYRCNSRELKLKFKKFMASYDGLVKRYGDKENFKEAVLAAARDYNREMDNSPRSRQLSKYFISKEVPILDELGCTVKKVVRSELATYLENALNEKEAGEVPDSRSEDWTTTML